MLLCACQLQVGGGDPAERAAGDAPAHEVAQVNGRGLDADVPEPKRAADAPVAEERDAALANDTSDAALHDAQFAHDAAVLDASVGLDGAVGIDGSAGSVAADGSVATDGAADGAVDAALRGDAGENGDAAQTCSVSGPFATEILFDVAWDQTTLAGVVPLRAAGTGQIRIVVRLDVGGNPESASTRLTVCGAWLPDFKSSPAVGSENYGTDIPERAWDSPGMPHPAFGLSFGCVAPGCALTTDQVVATFGVRTLPNDAWPGPRGALTQLVPLDQDGDGHPGITVISRGPEERNALGMPYAEVPVSWTLAGRAKEADIAFRVTGVFTGQIERCDQWRGVVSTGSVEARAFGCRAHREGSSKPFDCSADQSAFLDQNLPSWQVRGGTFRTRRVADGASCAAVRAAFQ